jgi:hypothetical protein
VRNQHYSFTPTTIDFLFWRKAQQLSYVMIDRTDYSILPEWLIQHQFSAFSASSFKVYFAWPFRLLNNWYIIKDMYIYTV